jgi:hypothetical protein
MSERALEFVETWIERKIETMAKSPSLGPTQGDALAVECLNDARKAGIPEAEIKDAYDDLAVHLASEIAEADARMHRPEEGTNLVEDDDTRAIDEQEDEAAGD